MTKDPRGRKPDPDRDQRVAAMERLREAGWKWREIGERYGLTRQGASQAVKRARKKV